MSSLKIQPPSFRAWSYLLAGFAVLFLAACGDDKSTTPTPEELTVSITAPAADAIVSGTVDIVVAASNADGVEFFVDGTSVGSDASPPYFLSWDSRSLPNGSHQIRATATRGTRTESASITIALNNVGGGISVILTPGQATLEPGEQQQFTATVLGDPNSGVTWSIEGGGPGTLSAGGLYTAPNPITPQTVQIRATSQADPSQSAVASIVLQNGPPEVAVSVSPGTAEVLLDATESFTATVTGTTNSGVTWAVLEGGAAGSIDSNGLYRAPSSLPDPPVATVRATSSADGTKFGQATVTLSDGSGFPVAEVDLLRSIYTAGFDTQNTISSSNDLMMRSVFFASCQNGNELTGSGSVVETGPNTGEFTWSPTPTDRLRIVFGTGESVEMNFKSFNGDTGDLDCDDHLLFDNNHAVDYTVTAAERLAIRIQTQIVPTSGTRTSHDQGLAGTITLGSNVWTAEGTLSGESTFFIDVGSGFSESTHNFLITALFTSGSTRIETNQRQTYRFTSGSSITSSEQSDTISATGTNGTVTFTLQDVVYSWTDTTTRDPFYSASGRLFRNGVAIGEFGADLNTGQVGIVLTDGTVVEL